jgi:two-component system catabolic regulation response regulator CreB/two-component system response regulator ChvI
MKILLVDDETDVLDSVRLGLESKGFQVDAFDDPLKALHSFRKGVYEIVLLDIRMPHMNGFQLYTEIRKRDEKVRVRFFTAFEVYREEFKKAFPELDERRFIQKPTTLDALTKTLLSELKVTN